MRTTDTQIYRLSGLCAFLSVLSLILPRFVPNPEGGFAGAANAVLVLLAMLVITLICSLYLLARTIGAYRDLSFGSRVAGIGPSIVLTLVVIAFFGFLRY